ncbi:CheR family methyltransferase [Thalassotalea hakodatensis]|uniref:CheR family methyltransferase n=1 Tax=Thalassotalea hakodatensis TaxID=3030492 RepID=UPI002572378C|nr:CheR family methyltransferase [Thalassotalea hakodatensis]
MGTTTRENIPTKEEFSLFQTLVHNRLGINLPAHKRVMLGHRLFKRLNALQLNNFRDYFNYINHLEHTKELETALELITTNETFFFREEKHFEFLQQKVLPNISVNKTFKIWSAAASTGEEPYSIAMLMQYHCRSSWQLMASDVNNSVLTHARKGIYNDERARFLPAHYRKEFCMKGIDEFQGFMRVKPSIRNKVQYFTFNLLDDMASIGMVDLIFIRNVMIYFTDETRQKIIDNIQTILNPKGWLFISHSETLHGLSHDFNIVQPAIYQRK